MPPGKQCSTIANQRLHRVDEVLGSFVLSLRSVSWLDCGPRPWPVWRWGALIRQTAGLPQSRHGLFPALRRVKFPTQKEVQHRAQHDDCPQRLNVPQTRIEGRPENVCGKLELQGQRQRAPE